MFYFLILSEAIPLWFGAVGLYFLYIFPLPESKTISSLSLIAMSMIFFLLPSLEMKMKIWGSLSLVALCVFFSTTSPSLLYTSFELSLIPVGALILGYGLQPERLTSFFYFMLYTMFFSMPLIFCIIAKITFSIFLMAAFMVKSPLFLFHLWLPKAHVEASTPGSVILAAVMLKTGSVGLFWVLTQSEGSTSFIWIPFLLMGIILSPLFCFAQSDLKAFVAYSSVAHMNFITLVILLQSSSSGEAGTSLMLAHAISSALLFMMAGAYFHLKASRIVFFFSTFSSLKSLMFFVLGMTLCLNFSFPSTLGFFGELPSLMSLISVSWSLLIPAFAYFFTVGFYCLFLGATSLSRMKWDYLLIESSVGLLSVLTAGTSFFMLCF